LSDAALTLAQKKPRIFESGIRKVLFACAFLSILTTITIVVSLVWESAPFFFEVSPVDFLLGTTWHPLIVPREYGVLPLVVGTLQIVVGSALVAIPIGVCCAIYLSEYATPRTRNIVKPVLEVLAGIPTIVYGYFALTAITPALKSIYSGTETYNAASASIVVGIMILPMIASLCDDALRAVPDSLRQGAMALGATRFEAVTRVIFPAALSGITASFVLAFSRAVGETMAVSIAAGATPSMSFLPTESIQTMTAFIVQVSMGDTPRGTPEYHAIFAVGMLLFLITLGINLIAHRFLKKFQEVYE
jgi:phosphate transport system permease protein